MKTLTSSFAAIMGGCIGICLAPFIFIGFSLIDAWLAVISSKFVIDPLLVQLGSTFSLAPITFWLWTAIFIVIAGIRIIFTKSGIPENSNQLILNKISSKFFVIFSLYILHWFLL